MIQNAWDGSMAPATGMQMIRSKLCMGLRYPAAACLEAKEIHRRFEECKPIFHTEIDHLSGLAANLSSFRLYPDLPKG